MQYTSALIFALAIITQARAGCPNNNGTHIRDQKVPGVGWAFAAVALVENQFYRDTCEVIPMLSVEQVLDRANSHCESAKRSTLWCALHYMHVEGIMYEADYPYTLGVRETQKYDAKKLAPIAISEPYAICTEGNVSVRENCTMKYLTNRSYASTICIDLIDLQLSPSDISMSFGCKSIYHSIVFLLAAHLASNVDAVYFQNSSGIGWGTNGVGRFLYLWYDRSRDEDPRNVLANALTIDVIRANHTTSSDTSASSDIGMSSDSNASAGDQSSESGDDESSDSVKNSIARVVPFALAFLAAILVWL